MEVRNRFKVLDLIDRVPDELWMEVCDTVQETGKVIRYSYLFKNFPQFVVIHTVEGFRVVNKAEIDVFLELSCFFDDPAIVGNLISGSSAFSKSSLNKWKFTVHILLTPEWRLRGAGAAVKRYPMSKVRET